MILRISTNVLFPTGYPGPPPIIPTIAEQAEIRAALIHRLSTLAYIGKKRGIRSWISSLVFGPTPEVRLQTIEGMLEPLSDERCNTLLVIFLLDAVVLAVFPELGAVTERK